MRVPVCLFLLHAHCLQYLNANTDVRAYEQMDNIEGEYAAPPSKLSLYWYDADTDPTGPDAKVQSVGGLSNIVDYLATGLTIALNKNVTDISYDR